MSYIYFNQRSYPDVPYTHPNRPAATIKSSGCGVCCGLMALHNLTDYKMTVKEAAQYAMSKGARDGSGTNLYTLLSAFKKDFAGFDYRTTSDKEELLAHLKTGGAAIANVGGDRGRYKGIFCTTGHFIYVAGLTADNQTIILDPDAYDGKYSGWRKAHVTVNGNECYCDSIRLDEDCSNKNPRYYLVAGVKNEKPEPTPAPEAHAYKIGDVVTVSSYYVSSTEQDSTKAVVPKKWVTATITAYSPIVGARNPYLLNNGDIGWCNDGDIRGRGTVNRTRTGTVATQKKNLNVRASASTDGKILGSLKKGTPVEILDEWPDWYQVRANGLTGWCLAEYIR